MGPQRALADLSAALCCVAAAAAVATAGVPAARQAELLYLLRQDCGSCHGTMTLKGGLGPSLTPAALAGRPADLLVDTILNGRPGTPMAPWHILLNEEEATWLVGQLCAGLPVGH